MRMPVGKFPFLSLPPVTFGGGVAGGVAGAGFGTAVALRAGGARAAKYAPYESSSASENSDPSGFTSTAHGAAMPTLHVLEYGYLDKRDSPVPVYRRCREATLTALCEW